MKRTKKILSLLLTLCMVLALFPTAVFAASSAEGFDDISPSAWYYDDVDYVAKHGYFNGTSESTFAPDDSMTRAMFVTVLSRLDGASTDDGVSPFSDVVSGTWYAGEVKWAVEAGIASGVGGNQFAPDRPVSRQDMATFMSRYLTYYTEKNKVTFKATGSAEAFPDAGEIADYAVDAVALCRSYGLINGYDDGTFAPIALSTRAQVAAVIHRLALLLETGETVNPAPTPSGGGGGGGGSQDTSSNLSVSTAADFIAAAQAAATRVTATVLPENSLTVNDDIAITNNSARTLTLNLGSASLGDLTINSTSATTITINGSTASVSSLTVNAPRANVTNNVTVSGSIDIQAVSHNTFNNTADVGGNILLSGPGSLNDTQATPVPVVIATDAEVTVRGNSSEINVTADGAQLTIAPTGSTTPTVNSAASGVELNVATGQQVIVGGTIDTVNVMSSTATLTVDGSVDTLSTTGGAITLSGSGSVSDMTAGGADVTIGAGANVTVSSVSVTSGGSITAPAGAIDTVSASGSVTLNASANTVTTTSGATLTLGDNATVNTVEAAGNLTLDGQGAVNSVDVTGGSATITSTGVDVSQITTSGDTSNISVSNIENVVVLSKAAKPTTIGFTAPVSAGGQGTITGVSSAMEYKLVTASDWTAISSTNPISANSGSYQVRVKATDTALASESVTVTIPDAVGVNAAAIQGAPYVGQTLTAVANAAATGTLSYEWKADADVIDGATGKTFTLTDAEIGKDITVTISNYGGTSAKTSNATAAVTVDKTALNKLIDKAVEVQVGVAVKDAAASKVALNVIFVTPAEKTALSDAISMATKLVADSSSDTASVEAGEAALRDAIDAYLKAKKVGAFDQVSTLQSELGTLVTSANSTKVTANTDATLVAPGRSWVIAADNTTFQTAIDAATAAQSNTDPAVLSQAITELNAALTAYIKAIRKGAVLDNSALLAAVNAAEINAASVVVDDRAEDVLPSQTWVTQAVLDAYNGAISTAKGVHATVQNDYITALETLNTATGTFNSAKANGTKDVIPPIVSGVSAELEGTTATVKLTSSEDGTYQYQLGSTNGAWTTAAALTANEEATFTFTLNASSATIYLQVSDSSGNSTIVATTVEASAPADTVASIGNSNYASLEAAITAATNGQTVKLLKSVALESGITIDKAITIDLNGHDISAPNKVFTVDGGSLELTGSGKVYESAPYYAPIMVIGGDDATVSNYSEVIVGENVTLEGWAGVFIDHKNKGAFGVNVEMSGAIVSVLDTGGAGGHGIYINGTANNMTNYPHIVVGENARITSRGNIIYAAGYADWTFMGGTFSGEQGLSIKSGVFDIRGGSYTATGAFADPAEANSNGSEATGAALSVTSNKSYAQNIEITVSGGTFTSEQGHAVYEGIAVKNSNPAAPNSYVSKLDITGGAFTGADGKASIAITKFTGTSITGGAFSSDPAAYLADGYAATLSGQVYTVGIKEQTPNDVASVGNRYFETLQAAVDAAEVGDTVKLVKEAELTDQLTIAAGDEIDLDLNGKTLTLNAAGARRIVNNGTLTITGNGGEIKGINDGAYGLIDNYGTLTINGGTLTDAGAGDGAALKNRNGTITLNQCTINATGTGTGNACVFSDGTLNINGGTFTNASSSAYAVIENSGTCTITSTVAAPVSVTGAKGGLGVNSGAMTVNGGAYEGNTYYGIWVTNDGATTDVTINDGSFTGKRYGLYSQVDDGKQDAGNVGILINGGSFHGETQGAAVMNSSGSSRDWGMSITGGTFSSDPTEYLAEGYTATESEGSWTVTKS